MDADRWQQLEALYHEALKLDPNRRPEFLRAQCNGDDSLCSAVAALLDQPVSADSVFDHPAFAVAARLLAGEAPPDTGDPLLGSTVGHFRILEKIGQGGMGVIYKAEDLKLPRHVALKLLPEILSQDPAALERFRREAHATSSLNDPNICTIHEIGEHEGKAFIVMELMEGMSLRDRIAAGPLTIGEVLAMGKDIASGLAAAHARGIIHRDIKPANVFITTQGHAKILDFGLAKLIPVQVKGVAADSTGELSLTLPGVAIGTLAYMSPEQARGEELDVRTDLFSFGATLYELATGLPAFEGKSLAELYAGILHEHPRPATQVDRRIPVRLQEIVSKALEKDRTLRYQTAAEMGADLKRLRRELATGAGKSVTDRHAEETKRKIRKQLGMAAAALMLVGIAAFFLLHLRPLTVHALSDRDTVVLADFTNNTGEPVFDATLKQALAIDFEQSPFLNIVSDRSVADTLRLMEKPPDQRITPDIARQLCLRLASKAMIEGSISRLGSHYAIQLKASRCDSGELLAHSQAEAESAEKVLHSLHQAASEARSRLGESLSSLQNFNQPIEQDTTSSLEAFRAYSDGFKVWLEKGDSEALPFMKRAVELDPEFARAYNAMGSMYSNLFEVNKSRESFQKAYELRDGLSARERYIVTAGHYSVTGEYEKALELYRLWLHDYPRDEVAHNDMSVILSNLGQFEKSNQLLREYGPTPSVFYYGNLALGEIALDRIDEAKTLMRDASNRKLENPLLAVEAYLFEFLKRNEVGMEKQVESARDRAGYEDILLQVHSDTQAYFGRLHKTRQLAREAFDSATREDHKEWAALVFSILGMREAQFGYQSRAVQDAQNALKILPGRDVRTVTAWIYASAGNTARAHVLIGELNHDFPLDTMVQNYSIPCVLAQVELVERHPDKAIETLERTRKYELGATQLDRLYPVYLRGQAYLQAHSGTAAAAEFQKILDHPGLMGNGATGALARLYLGRARALQAKQAIGNQAESFKSQARAAYQDFLTLWKDADPNLPILKQAKAEYARLQ